MIEFDIEPGSVLQTAQGIAPTHKITVKHGTEISVFWYLQHPRSSAPDFDHGSVKQMHTCARSLSVGDFLYLSLDQGGDYHLHRLGRDRFILKPLDAAGAVCCKCDSA